MTVFPCSRVGHSTAEPLRVHGGGETAFIILFQMIYIFIVFTLWQYSYSHWKTVVISTMQCLRNEYVKSS